MLAEFPSVVVAARCAAGKEAHRDIFLTPTGRSIDDDMLKKCAGGAIAMTKGVR
jgi:hypothetical protein